jgi:hypothetical protein
MSSLRKSRPRERSSGGPSSYQPNTPPELLAVFAKVGWTRVGNKLPAFRTRKLVTILQEMACSSFCSWWLKKSCNSRLSSKSPLATCRPGCSPWTAPLFGLKCPQWNLFIGLPMDHFPKVSYGVSTEEIAINCLFDAIRLCTPPRQRFLALFLIEAARDKRLAGAN